MAKIGYARVSTADQNLDAQTDALTAAGCDRIFADKASGKLASRPQFDKALDYVRPGDVLVVTKLDRLGRSLHHLLDLMRTLDERQIDLLVTAQGIDTTTAVGRFFFHITGAFAEFEREMISERTRDGLAAARARGRRGGRRPVLTDRQVALVREMYDSKRYSIQAIAEAVRASRATIYRQLEKRELDSAHAL